MVDIYRLSLAHLNPNIQIIWYIGLVGPQTVPENRVASFKYCVIGSELLSTRTMFRAVIPAVSDPYPDLHKAPSLIPV